MFAGEWREPCLAAVNLSSALFMAAAAAAGSWPEDKEGRGRGGAQLCKHDYCPHVHSQQPPTGAGWNTRHKSNYNKAH